MTAIPSAFDLCVQVNLQQSLGGGEIYTAAAARAMERLGVPTLIVHHRSASFWPGLDCGNATFQAVDRSSEVPALRFEGRVLYIVHAGLDGDTIASLHQGDNRVATFAHMPFHERSPDIIARADIVCAVSGYVLSTLQAKGVHNLFPEPFFGVADLKRGSAPEKAIRRRSEFDWDKRKVRERLQSIFSPWLEHLRRDVVYTKPSGITLGLVSRITTIKQFPELFRCLVPVLRDYPDVHLAIFGQGGYKSVRDLKRILAPLGNRVSFWGHQSDVLTVYQSIDWLMSGLPEKEALGLNIIEAQFVGLPVLAVDAPPFTETVCDGVTGLRYCDPRKDAGAGFRAALDRICQGAFQADATARQQHLSRFTEEAFAARFAKLLTMLSGSSAPA